MKYEKESQIPYEITSIWSLKYGKNVLIYETESQTRGQARGGIDWESGISRYKLLYIKGINNKAILYGIGNYFQYHGINHNGKKFEKECIYAYIYKTKSLCSTVEINTIL